jgi:hypothetical protein
MCVFKCFDTQRAFLIAKFRNGFIFIKENFDHVVSRISRVSALQTPTHAPVML